ncbi:MAG: AMP-binding protein [Ilumatobacteraceae bacterium]
MHRLVALDIPGDSKFVDAMRRIWDAGDAVFPVDQRIPKPARDELFLQIAPSAIIDASGTESKMTGGRAVDSGDALVIATSGSSGAPKGVVLTHDGIAASAAASNRRLGTTTSDHWLACLPLSHVGGMAVIIRALHAKCQLTVQTFFDIALVEDAARHGANMTSLVATTLRQIDASLFRTILLGGAAAPEHVPTNVVVTYGMTESGGGVVYDGQPLDGVEIRLASDGEIQIKGLILFRQYRDGTRPIDSGGWFSTGDLGEFANDGRLIVHGRRGDLIITGGENVWPQQVESILALHPRIGEVVVRGVPDAQWGQQVVAWITINDDRELSLPEIRDWVKQSLPAFCAPKLVHVVDSIPRTTNGKIEFKRLPFGNF